MSTTDTGSYFSQSDILHKGHIYRNKPIKLVNIMEGIKLILQFADEYSILHTKLRKQVLVYNYIYEVTRTKYNELDIFPHFQKFHQQY